MSKVTLSGILIVVVVLSIYFFSAADPHQKLTENLTGQKMKSSSVFSGSANPNWWQKNDGALPIKTHINVKVNKKEQLTDFLQFSPSVEWQPMADKNGVAVASYQLDLAEKHYQLAIIRMKKVMPLATIMNIWQQKAGLPAVNEFTAVQKIRSEHQQEFSLYEINGVKQSIALAVHAGDKYTFFRLSCDQHIDDQVMTKFTEMLFFAEII